MKKLIYLTVVVSTVILQPVFGAEVLEANVDPRIGCILRAIRNNPDALSAFIDIAASSPPKSTKIAGYFQREDDQEIEDPTGYALTPVPAAEQIRLTVSDIIANNEKALNFQKVFYVDLSDLDFRTGTDHQKVFDYLNQNTLSNLQTLNLRNSRGISYVIEELFGSSNPKNKYASLFRMNAYNSDITPKDFDIIYSHFSGYSYFVRDQRQVSDEYDVTAVFFSIGISGVESLGNISGWLYGKKTPSKYDILYRSESEKAKGPFIMSIDF